MKILKIIVVALVFLNLISCKKTGNEVGPVGDEKGGTMSMEIDGTLWNGNCGAVDTKNGTGINVSILSDNKPKDDIISITLVGYTGTGDYSANFKAESSLTVIHNGLTYKYDKKSADPLVVKITESSLPTTPLGPGKIAGEFSGTLKNIVGGKSLVLAKGKFQTTSVL